LNSAGRILISGNTYSVDFDDASEEVSIEIVNSGIIVSGDDEDGEFSDLLIRSNLATSDLTNCGTVLKASRKAKSVR
jgi:hypothetical protein